MNKLNLRNPIYFLALGCGSGLAPKAPGTFGTLAAIPFYYFFQYLSLSLYTVMLVVTCLFGIYICAKASQTLGMHDHPSIVWDEFVGYWLTMYAAPSGWCWIILGFLLFRIFDILKPYPINLIDAKVQGGLGIMLDDLVAGVFACACLHLIVHFY